MSKLVISGGTPLHGTVRVSGSKNAALPILAAAVLTSEPCVIRRVPDLTDVRVMLEILSRLGAEVLVTREEEEGGLIVRLQVGRLASREIHEVLMRQMRSSLFLMGPLLAREGMAVVSTPGGCAIGPRPINLHLEGLKAMGATIEKRHGNLYAIADRLQGAEIHLDYPSVGATENLLMAATLAEGLTIIRNAAREPEIIDLQNFLNGMGARVRGAGSDVIRVSGVDRLHGVQHTVIPDRIEAGTYLLAGAITGGAVTVTGMNPEHLHAVIAKLRQAGLSLTSASDWVRVEGASKYPIHIKTHPYPGFPTDMQPQFMALSTQVSGISVITEAVFENRFRHIDEFRRMGATVWVEGRNAMVEGGTPLLGATLEAVDLRSGAALVLAALAASGTSEIHGLQHIERGYEAIEGKLQSLGAQILRQKEMSA